MIFIHLHDTTAGIPDVLKKILRLYDSKDIIISEIRSRTLTNFDYNDIYARCYELNNVQNYPDNLVCDFGDYYGYSSNTSAFNNHGCYHGVVIGKNISKFSIIDFNDLVRFPACDMKGDKFCIEKINDKTAITYYSFNVLNVRKELE